MVPISMRSFVDHKTTSCRAVPGLVQGLCVPVQQLGEQSLTAQVARPAPKGVHSA